MSGFVYVNGFLMAKPVLCLLIRILKEKEIWLDFLNSFTTYEIFVVIDDNSIDCVSEYSSQYTNIHFVQIDNEICKANGYINCNSCVGFNEVISWDKALYYFNRVYKDYTDIWFIEDDVFFLSEESIKDIDNQYTESDLLTAFHEVNESGEMYSWNHWVNVINKIELPWCHSMVCACRMSRELMIKVDEYVKRHGQLYFIESIFNTLAHQNKMKIDNPSELSSVHWNTAWDKDHIDGKKIYHPFKNIDDHLYIRQKLQNSYRV